MPTVLEAPRIPNPSHEKHRAAVGLHNLFVRFSPEPDSIPQPGRIEREMRDIAALSRDVHIQNLVGACFEIGDGEAAKSQSIRYVHEITSLTSPYGALLEEVDTRWKKKPQVLATMVDTLTFLRDQGQMDPRAVAQSKELVSIFTKTLKEYSPSFVRVDSDETQPSESSPVAEKVLEPENMFQSPRFSNTTVLVDSGDVHKKDTKIHVIKAPEAQVGYLQGLSQDGTAIETHIPTENGEITYSTTLLVQENGVWRKTNLAEPIEDGSFDPARHVVAQKKGIWTADLPSEKSRYAIVVQATPWYRDSKERKHEDKSLNTMFVNSEDEANFYRIVKEGGLMLFKDYQNDNQVRMDDWGARRALDYLEQNDLYEVLNYPLLTERIGEDSFLRLALNFTVRVGTAENFKMMPLQALIDSAENVGVEVFSGITPSDKKDEDDDKRSLKERNDQQQILEVMGIDSELSDDGSEVFVFSGGVTHFASLREKAGDPRGKTPTRRRPRDIFLQPLAHHESTTTGDEHANKVQVVPLVGLKTEIRDTSEMEDITTLGDLLYYIACRDYKNQYNLLPATIHSPFMRNMMALEEQLLFDRSRGIQDWSGFTTRSYGQGGLMKGNFGDANTVFGERERGTQSKVGSSHIVAQLPSTEVGTVVELTPKGNVKKKIRRMREIGID